MLFQGEVLLLPKMSNSVLSVFSLRQLSFIHSVTSVMHLWNLVLVVEESSDRERMSWVSSAYEIMFSPWDSTMLARGVM